MNICMICPEIGNSGGSGFIGGHTNNVIQLSKELHDRGHQITLITTPHRYPSNQPTNPILNGIDVISLPISSSFSSIKYGFKFAIGVTKKIKDINHTKRFDIIHGHSGYTMPALITGMSAKLVNVPAIHTIYSPIEPSINNLNFCRLFSNHSFSKLFTYNIEKIIAVSANIRHSLVNSGISHDRIEWIPPGINMDVFNPLISCNNIRNIYGVSPTDIVLVYVGSLTRIKGINVLIDALTIVLKKNQNLKLFMVLNMPLKVYLEPSSVDMDMELIFNVKEKIKNNHLEEHVIPIGIVNNMSEILAASNVFVLPFLNTVGVADYPLSMLEAMAVGKPIIATNIGGISEIIKDCHTGMLVEPNNVEELANKILFYVENKNKFTEVGKRNSETVRDKFSVQVTVDNIVKLYRKVIAKGCSA